MDARSHFANRLEHETDVADVAAAMRAGESDFVLLDVRSRAAYDAGHLPGAVSLHHSEITAESVAALPGGPVVAYCWGPSCNGACKAAASANGVKKKTPPGSRREPSTRSRQASP